MIQISVLSVGRNVKIGRNVDGIITAVCLRNNRIMYEVAWWDRCNRVTQWLEEFEVAPADDDQRITMIGFHPDNARQS